MSVHSHDRGLSAPQKRLMEKAQEFFRRFWKDLLDAGGFAQAREKGLIRTEGKNYVVQDGDVIEIKHNA